MSYRNLAYLSKQKLMRLYTWDDKGNRIHIDSAYQPYLYTETAGTGDAVSIFNTQLKKKTFFSQFDRNNFIKTSSTSRIFENLSVQQQFLIDTYWSVNEKPEFTKNKLKIGILDIETDSRLGFPNIMDPNDPINVITIYDNLSDHFFTWGLKPYTRGNKENFTYVHCETEKQLLLEFIKHNEKNPYDIWTGWNTEYFDFPYMLGRMNKLLGESETSRLSPVQRIYNRTIHDQFGKDRIRWYIEGLSCIDYLELYKRFCMEKRDSYKLDKIGELEVDENKVDYGGQNLFSLADNDWDTFVDYNVQDVNIIKKLDIKLKYMDLLKMLAYMGLTTFEGALGSIGPITGAIAIRARYKGLIIPTFIREGNDTKNPGAFVADPKRGFKQSIVSFDANSLYPNLMISLNMSPETKIGKIISTENNEVTIQHVNGQQFTLSNDKFNQFIVQEQVAVTQAKILFSQKKKGVVAEMVDYYFQSRVKIQQELEKHEKAIAIIEKKLKKESNSELEDKLKELEIKKEQLNTKQQCIKIFINATYGTFGNKHAPMGDDDIASSITLTGQEVIKQGREIAKQFTKEFDPTLTPEQLEEILIGSDTDSLYLSIEPIIKVKSINFAIDGNITPETHELVKQLDVRLNSDIKQYVQKEFNSIDSRIKFKREILSDSAMFLEKKRYVAHILDNKGIPCNKFKYTGVDVVRTNMPKVIKPHVKKIIETMLLTRDYTKTTKVFNEAYEVFKNLSLDEISFTKGISNYDKYASQCSEFTVVKGMPMHVKAAYFYNLMLNRQNLSSKYEKIGSGDKLKHFYVSQPNKFGIQAIGFKYKFPDEFKQLFFIDYEKMFDKIVFAAIEKFYLSVGWKIKDPSYNPQTDIWALLS